MATTPIGNVFRPEYWHNVLNQIRLTWRLMGDSRVPLYLKAIPVLTLLYILSPIDLIPGWIFPIVGQLDDLAVLLIGINTFIRLIPPEVIKDHQPVSP